MVIGVFDALLLFLAGDGAKSGYDIRRLFQATPLGIFSDSPGAVYPALARLEHRGLLRSSVEKQGRRRRTYGRTAAGEKALRAWIAEPIDRELLARRPQEFDLRFVITGEFVSWAEAQRFAARCEKLYAADLQRIKEYRDGPGRTMGRTSLAAIELGMRSIRTRLAWCRDVMSNRVVVK